MMASSTTSGFILINTPSQIKYVDFFRITTTKTTTISTQTKELSFNNLFHRPIKKIQTTISTNLIDSKITTPAVTHITEAEKISNAVVEAATITRKSCLKKNYVIERRPVSTTTSNFIITNKFNADFVEDNDSDSDLEIPDDEVKSEYDFTNYRYVQVRPPGYIDPKKRSKTPLPVNKLSTVRKVSFDEALNETRLFCHEIDDDEPLKTHLND